MGAPEDIVSFTPLAPSPSLSGPTIDLGYTLRSRREGSREAICIQGPGRLPRERQEDKILLLNRFFNLTGAIIPNSGNLLCDG